MNWVGTKDLSLMPGEGRAELRREGTDGVTEPKVAQRSRKITVAEASFIRKKIGERNITDTYATMCLYHRFCNSREGSWAAPVHNAGPTQLHSVTLHAALEPHGPKHSHYPSQRRSTRAN